MRLYLDWAFRISDLRPADSRESWGHSVPPEVSPLPLSKMPSLVQWVWLHWELPGWILHAKPFLNHPFISCLIKKTNQEQIHQQNSQERGDRGQHQCSVKYTPYLSISHYKGRSSLTPWVLSWKIQKLFQAPSSWSVHRNFVFEAKILKMSPI